MQNMNSKKIQKKKSKKIPENSKKKSKITLDFLSVIQPMCRE
jgi:hypothetical protein